jgi:hypothetical protein
MLDEIETNTRLASARSAWSSRRRSLAVELRRQRCWSKHGQAYRRGLATRAINWWFRMLTRLGLGASYRHISRLPGRRTGQLHLTPVDVIELNGHRWLVAGYRPANWVLNAHASGEVTLSRGGQTKRYKIAEAGAEHAVSVLRKYIGEIRVTRTYFDATPSSSDAPVAAELGRHPVFRPDTDPVSRMEPL